MQKVKEFILNYKKTLFIVLIILLMAIIVGGMMLSKPKSQSTEKKENVIEETNKIDEVENTNNNPSTSESKQQEKEAEKQEQDKKSNSSTKSSTTKSSSQTDAKKSASQSTSTNTNKTQSSQSTTPSHQHVWKEHTAKRWVSKMVTVQDYKTQKVAVGNRYIFAYDGYTTVSDEEAENHAMELVLAGVDDGYRMETIYEERQVQVGSHQEDQGYYETYVDYYYCDCGARKEA